MVIVTVMLCVIFGLVLHFTHEGIMQASIRSMDIGDKGPGGPPDQFKPLHFTISENPDGTLTVRGDALARQYNEEDILYFWNTAKTAERRQGILTEYALRFSPAREPKSNGITFVDISGELAAMAALWRSCSMIAIFAWLIMLVVSYFLAKWVVRPVERAWQQQKQFVADASHELKTPLTVIMTNAELLENPSCPEENRAQSIGSILTMCRQMRHLVEGLLELARADNGTMQIHFEKTDLSAVVFNEVLPFEALFFERELMLETNIEPEIFVHGSEEYLRQVLGILLDNAQKYAQSPGQVTLTLETKGKTALLRLETPGTPLTREQQKKIFQRFYRVDPARTPSGSYGLGLSIALQIVRSHKGKIWAETGDHSNIFCIQLPTF
jgi:signal transduction histidine kinase